MGRLVEGVEEYTVKIGEVIELRYEGNIFRRTDYLLIENKAKEQERILNPVKEQPPVKYEKITNKGKMLHDTIAESTRFEKSTLRAADERIQMDYGEPEQEQDDER